MKNIFLLRAISLLILLALLFPFHHASALAVPQLPPVDMFQLPWDQGLAWVAIDGVDNGSKRPASSSHNHKLGGAIDFAPKSTMITGENTSNFWVTAAASGIVVETSNCHLAIAHENGWITKYLFLGNIQVKLGDTVARNQRLAIIADGIRYKYCSGYVEPNVPHLHFMLRPTMIGATFAGWQLNYNPLFNRTTFTKGLITVGLFKPLLNVLDVPPTLTSTPTASPTASPTGSLTATPTASPTGSPTATQTITPPSGPYVSTTVNLPNIQIGETTLATVSLNNVPPNEYTSAEFTCAYDENLIQVSNIVVASLFGADPATAITTPQNGSFIVAIAGSSGNKATTSGAAFTFNANALQAGQTELECTARVSIGNNALTDLPSIGTSLTITGSEPTATETLTPIPNTPTIPPTACDSAQLIADITVPDGTVMLPGTTFTKTWRLKNIGTCNWTTSYQLIFFSGEQMGGVSSVNFTQNVAVGQTVDVSINLTAPNVPGSYRGYWMFKNANGALFGIGAQANHPWWVDIRVSDSTGTPGGPTATPSQTETATPGGGPIFTATPTSPTNDWLTFTNLTYGFEFKYPSQGVIASGQTDTFAHINLPFVQGTNLHEKYLQVDVAQNASPCRSPVAASSITQSSSTVTINGISFLKEVGGDAAAGNLYQFVAYSTLRDNVCVSLSLVLHSLNPGNSIPTEIPFDYAAEIAVVDQIIATYTWLATSTPTLTGSPAPPSSETPTSTPTSGSFPTPFESPTPTSIPGSSPTPSGNNGAVAGQLIVSKPVTVNVYDATNTLVATTETTPDGRFRLEAAPGTYTVVAVAPGFLRAQGTVTLTTGNTIILPPITLPAGDIDENNVIDQFDALTIGMNYNTNVPEAADLNNDGIINVLDLELLAKNYRMMGPVVWE